jgi:hypothetical protein
VRHTAASCCELRANPTARHARRSLAREAAGKWATTRRRAEGGTTFPLSSHHVTQHREIERLVGDQLLQPAILVLESFALLRLTDLQSAVVLLPAVVGRRRDAVPPAHLADGRPRGGFLQDPDELGLREPTLPHLPGLLNL